MRRFLIVLPVLLLLSCGGDDSSITAPTTGTVVVTTATTGDAPDGYTVTLDGGSAQPIGAAGTVTFSDVVPGPHAVQLTALPAGCLVTGENPRTVSISAGATASETFEVTCTPPGPTTGSIRIVTSTTGTLLDPDGYLVALDDGAPQPIGVAASITVADVATGAHTVTLSEVAANCTVEGDNPQPVTVATGATAEVSFAVTCGSGTVGQWTRMQSRTAYSLQAVWGSGAADVYTVGEPGGAFVSTIFHYDGQAWAPHFTQNGATLTSLWGSGPADVFAVGADPLGDFGYQGAIIHYDGATWSPMVANLIGSGEVALYGVWGSSATDVFAVGENFTEFSNAVVAHYDGTAWAPMALPESSDRVLRDVHGTSATNVFAVGNVDLSSFVRRGSAPRPALRVPGSVRKVQSSLALILRYDGSAWTEEVRSEPDLVFFGVWSAAPDDAFAVGAVGETAAIHHFDGTAWSAMTVPPVGPLFHVWGASGTDVYAVGDGTILHYDGAAWTEVQTLAQQLTGVWGSSPADVFAVGESGTIMHGTPAVSGSR